MIKTPRSYPKIPDTRNCPLKQCIAFEKYDGTNFNVVWSQNAWKSFGTRRYKFDFNETGIQELLAKYDGLMDAPAIFKRVYAPVENFSFFKDKEIILYFEFLGDASFAGTHQKNDPKRLVLIDAMVDGKMLPPQKFIDIFAGTPHPEYHIGRVVYKGKYSGQLVEDVRKGKYDVFEGVIIKGEVEGEVYRAKIKTDAYMKRLQESFKDDWKNFWE